MSDGSRDDQHTPIHGIPILTKRDLMNATKEAVKELLREQITAFGYWSVKTIGVALLGAVVLFVLWINGFGKVHGS